MPEPIKFICSCSGKEHEQWPSLAYSSPTAYNNLSDDEKQTMGSLTSDFCTIRHPEQTDNYIRCVLIQKVTDHCQDLQYGLWVSLSDKSFEDYSAKYKNDIHETKYFGWLSNNLPDYTFEESIPTTVFTQLGNQRPEIVPHNEFEHPFVHDYYNGITKAEAERRIRNMLESIKERDNSTDAIKKWWKFW